MNEIERLADSEDRKIRLLRRMTDLTIQVLMTMPVSAERADRIIAGTRSFALRIFPGKGDVFDLVYMPRFRRAVAEAGIERSHGHVRPASHEEPFSNQ